jgi:hypothetical protein
MKKLKAVGFREQRLGGRMFLPPDPKGPVFLLGYMLTSN